MADDADEQGYEDDFEDFYHDDFEAYEEAAGPAAPHNSLSNADSNTANQNQPQLQAGLQITNSTEISKGGSRAPLTKREKYLLYLESVRTGKLRHASSQAPTRQFSVGTQCEASSSSDRRSDVGSQAPEDLGRVDSTAANAGRLPLSEAVSSPAFARFLASTGGVCERLCADNAAASSWTTEYSSPGWARKQAAARRIRTRGAADDGPKPDYADKTAADGTLDDAAVQAALQLASADSGDASRSSSSPPLPADAPILQGRRRLPLAIAPATYLHNSGIGNRLSAIRLVALGPRRDATTTTTGSTTASAATPPAGAGQGHASSSNNSSVAGQWDAACLICVLRRATDDEANGTPKSHASSSYRLLHALACWGVPTSAAISNDVSVVVAGTDEGLVCGWDLLTSPLAAGSSISSSAAISPLPPCATWYPGMMMTSEDAEGGSSSKHQGQKIENDDDDDALLGTIGGLRRRPGGLGVTTVPGSKIKPPYVDHVAMLSSDARIVSVVPVPSSSPFSSSSASASAAASASAQAPRHSTAANTNSLQWSLERVRAGAGLRALLGPQEEEVSDGASSWASLSRGTQHFNQQQQRQQQRQFAFATLDEGGTVRWWGLKASASTETSSTSISSAGWSLACTASRAWAPQDSTTDTSSNLPHPHFTCLCLCLPPSYIPSSEVTATAVADVTGASSSAPLLGTADGAMLPLLSSIGSSADGGNRRRRRRTALHAYRREQQPDCGGIFEGGQPQSGAPSESQQVWRGYGQSAAVTAAVIVPASGGGSGASSSGQGNNTLAVRYSDGQTALFDLSQPLPFKIF